MDSCPRAVNSDCCVLLKLWPLCPYWTSSSYNSSWRHDCSDCPSGSGSVCPVALQHANGKWAAFCTQQTGICLCILSWTLSPWQLWGNVFSKSHGICLCGLPGEAMQSLQHWHRSALWFTLVSHEVVSGTALCPWDLWPSSLLAYLLIHVHRCSKCPWGLLFLVVAAHSHTSCTKLIPNSFLLH